MGSCCLTIHHNTSITLLVDNPSPLKAIDISLSPPSQLPMVTSHIHNYIQSVRTDFSKDLGRESSWANWHSNDSNWIIILHNSSPTQYDNAISLWRRNFKPVNDVSTVDWSLIALKHNHFTFFWVIAKAIYRPAPNLIFIRRLNYLYQSDSLHIQSRVKVVAILCFWVHTIGRSFSGGS